MPKIVDTFKNLRALLGVVAGYARLEAAIIEELEAQSIRLYALEERVKLNGATLGDHMKRIPQLELAVNGKISIPAVTDKK